MQKEFSLSNEKAMINFTAKYCDNAEALFDSYGFARGLGAYLDKIKRRETRTYRYLISNLKDDKNLQCNLTKIFKLLMVLKADEIVKFNPMYEKLLEDKDKFIALIEDLYNFWRKLERYTIVQNHKTGDGLQNVSFIEANEKFSKLILDTYRKAEENVIGEKPRVYRQLPGR